MRKLAFQFVLILFTVSCGKEKDPTPETVTGSIVTNPALNISYFEATIEGELLKFSDGQIYDCGFVWSENSLPTTESTGKVYFGPKSSPIKLSNKIINIKTGTKYYYRAFAILKTGITYGNELAFTTLSNPWKQGVDFEGSGRQNAVTFSIGGMGYVCLGNGDGNVQYKDMWEFNPINKTWKQKADYPGTDKLAANGFAIGSKGYVVTGLCSCKDLWEYDPSLDKWTQKSDFPVNGVYYASSFTIDNKGYIGTGTENGMLLKDFWEYDPSNDVWTKRADFPGIPMDVAVGFSVLGKGYFATGNQATGTSQSLWEYNPTSDIWNKRKDFPYATSSAVGFSINNKGYVGLGNGVNTTFYEYDPLADTWLGVENFRGSGRQSAKAFVINNVAYIGLGTSSYTVYPKDFWEFTSN